MPVSIPEMAGRSPSQKLQEQGWRRQPGSACLP
jgi:hypothetical protein